MTYLERLSNKFVKLCERIHVVIERTIPHKRRLTLNNKFTPDYNAGQIIPKK